MRLQYVALILSFNLFQVAQAEVSFGTKVDGDLGVSIQVDDLKNTAYHVGLSMSPGTYAKIDIEYLVFPYALRTSRLWGTTYEVHTYYGFGARGESTANDPMHELFYGKIPVGLLLKSYTSSLQAFIDASPKLGPLPTLSMTPMFRIGLRTRI